MRTWSIKPVPAVFVILALLAGIYIAINWRLFSFLGTVTGTYVVRPLLWGVVIWVVLSLPKYRTAAKPRFTRNIVLQGFLFGFFQVIAYVIGGMFSGFGRSPYSFTLIGVFTNLLLVSATLIGMELSRSWLINYLGKRYTFLAIVFMALLFTVISLSLSQITGIRLEVESMNFLNSTLLPTFTENLLATLLALLAGPLAAMAYRGTLEVFWWFCPVLPNLPWAFKGLIGTVVPIFGMVIINSYYSWKTGHRQPKHNEKGSFPVGWIITSVAAVLIVWFAVGLFPFQPALVGSGSMQPVMYTGDVVIIAKVPENMIKEGDIIQFHEREGFTVVHRLIEVRETESGTVFITKGDANDEPDREPVQPANVIGKAVYTIPKVGWISVWVKQLFTGWG